MLQTYPYGDTLGFDGHPVGIQPAVYVACRMSCSQNHRTVESLSRIRFNACYLVVLDEQGIHACLEVHLSATGEDGVSHVFNHPRQLVGSDVRMRVYQDRCACSVLAEHVQNLVHAATLLAARIQLAVGVSSRTSFTETVVRFRVHLVFTADAGKIRLAVAHVLSALHHHRTQSQLYQTQGSKQTARSGSHHNHLRLSLHVAVFRPYKLLLGRRFVDEHLYLQVYVNRPLAGVDAPFQYPYGVYGTNVEPLFTAHVLLDMLFAGCLLGQNS